MLQYFKLAVCVLVAGVIAFGNCASCIILAFQPAASSHACCKPKAEASPCHDESTKRKPVQLKIGCDELIAALDREFSGDNLKAAALDFASDSPSAFELATVYAYRQLQFDALPRLILSTLQIPLRV